MSDATLKLMAAAGAGLVVLAAASVVGHTVSEYLHEQLGALIRTMTSAF